MSSRLTFKYFLKLSSCLTQMTVTALNCLFLCVFLTLLLSASHLMDGYTRTWHFDTWAVDLSFERDETLLFCFFVFLPLVFNVEFGHFRALRLVYFFGGCSRCDMPDRWLHVIACGSRWQQACCAGVHSNAASFPRTIAEGSVVSTSENRHGRSRFHWGWDSLEYAAVLALLQIPFLSFRRAGGSITSQENGNVFTAWGQIHKQKQH